MPQQIQWPTPAWHAALPEDEKNAATARFLLGIAAIYGTEEGTISALADNIGMGRNALLQARKRGRITPDLAVKLEEALGREHFPRELFRPDLFLIES